MNYLKMEQFLEYSEKTYILFLFGGNLKWNL